MRAPKIPLAALVTLSLLGWTAAANASCYANFAGNCSRSGTGPAYCVFDGNRTYTYDTTPTSCNGGVSLVFWDFDDGGSTWDDLYVSHTFSNPAAIDNDAIVRMTVFCGDNCSIEGDRYVIFVQVGCPGCLNMNVGWN